MIRLICIQTYHGHWAGPSGYHNYLPHLKDRFNLDHRRIERGEVDRAELKGSERYFFPVLMPAAKKLVNNPWATEKDLLEEFRLVKQVKEALANGEKVVVHFMDGEVGFNFFGHYIASMGKERERLRLIATYHQPPMYLKKVLIKKERAGKLDMVLTVGTSQFPFFDSLSQPKLKFVPHGVDTDFFHPTKHPKRSDKLYCITVGQWLRDFDALEKVVQKAPQNIIFRFVAVKESLKRFHDLPNVELYSGIEDTELRRLYQESHIGLMPLQDATANNSLLEMMASGMPIIVSRVGSIEDYVNDECCILLEDNEPEAILDSITSLTKDLEKMVKLGQSARQQALVFSWPRIAELMTDIYSWLPSKESL